MVATPPDFEAKHATSHGDNTVESRAPKAIKAGAGHRRVTTDATMITVPQTTISSPVINTSFHTWSGMTRQ